MTHPMPENLRNLTLGELFDRAHNVSDITTGQHISTQMVTNIDEHSLTLDWKRVDHTLPLPPFRISYQEAAATPHGLIYQPTWELPEIRRMSILIPVATVDDSLFDFIHDFAANYKEIKFQTILAEGESGAESYHLEYLYTGVPLSFDIRIWIKQLMYALGKHATVDSHNFGGILDDIGWLQLVKYKDQCFLLQTIRSMPEHQAFVWRGYNEDLYGYGFHLHTINEFTAVSYLYEIQNQVMDFHIDTSRVRSVGVKDVMRSIDAVLKQQSAPNHNYVWTHTKDVRPRLDLTFTLRGYQVRTVMEKIVPLLMPLFIMAQVEGPLQIGTVTRQIGEDGDPEELVLEIEDGQMFQSHYLYPFDNVASRSAADVITGQTKLKIYSNPHTPKPTV